jgi:hypothetical protein
MLIFLCFIAAILCYGNNASKIFGCDIKNKVARKIVIIALSIILGLSLPIAIMQNCLKNQITKYLKK